MYKLTDFYTVTGKFSVGFYITEERYVENPILVVHFHDWQWYPSCRCVKFNLEKIKSTIAYYKLINYVIRYMYYTQRDLKNRRPYVRSITETEFFECIS